MITSLSDLVFPRVCLVCACELGLDEKHICLSCLLDFPQTKFAAVARNPISTQLNAQLSKLAPDSYHPYSLATALFYYHPNIQGMRDYGNISKDLKYRRNFPAGRFFASMLAKEIRQSPLYQDVDLVVPVPLHWTRRLKRGYNQAEILSVEIARTMMTPLCVSNLLIRRHRTKQQTKLGVKAKSQNVEGAFALNIKYLDLIQRAKHILIIDDIFTTGATISQCIITLRKATLPNTKISAATLGYVGQV